MLVLLASIVAVNACSADTRLPSDINITAVTASEFRFDPPLIKIKPEQRVIFVFKNRGAVVHDFIMRDGDFRVETKVAPGESDVLVFTTPRRGSYRYICSILGHEEADMIGTLMVE